MADEFEPGMVWLVGAGPGDPDLLTRKAESLIRAATIIFYDALVGQGVIDLIPAHVRRVFVGKRSGRHSYSQAEITGMLIKAAHRGERIVRLKGGDPSVFGRSGEEVAALADRGTKVRICPGVTAASAAAASAGISLTLRGVSRSVTLLTAHAMESEPLGLDWKALAALEGTIAIYMGKAQAAGIARNLMGAGLRGDMPALIVENASLKGERLLFTRLDRLGPVTRSVGGSGPTLLLIGAAVARPRRRCRTILPFGHGEVPTLPLCELAARTR